MRTADAAHQRSSGEKAEQTQAAAQESSCKQLPTGPVYV